MDFHLLFMQPMSFEPTPSPTPLPTPTPIVARSLETIMLQYVHEYELALFWWALRVSFYYLFVREITSSFLPAILKSAKAYVESFFPPSLVSIAEPVVEECLDTAYGAALDGISKTVESLEAARADPAQKLKTR